ncbi:MAG: response regulator [Cyanobacteria bacterium]|nr:response regulator [Cyanobacteriota bacterium]
MVPAKSSPLDQLPPVSKILIVDDTPANLKLLANGLTEQGYEVRMAPSGTLALMTLANNLPDLILLDICMPKMDGFEVCQRLKANPAAQDIPVIFLSALQDGADKTRAFEEGGDDYITKPFQMEEVLVRVRHHLHKRQLQQQLEHQQMLLVQQNQQLQQEIRDRQRAESALSQERTLLRNLIDAIPDFIFYKDVAGRYQLCNQAFANFVGRSPDAILQHTDADLFSAPAAAWMQTKDHQVLSSQTPLRHEEWATYNDGHRRLLDTYKVPLTHADGGLYGLLGICRDITELKATETHLNRTASRLSTLIRALQAGILVENERREIVLANQWFCDLFHIPMPPGELVGMDCAALAADSAQVWAEPSQNLTRIEAILSARLPVTAEEVYLADGRIFERDYIPIISGDNFQGHLWQYRDITARKASEQALRQASQALTAFSESLKQLHRLSLQPFDTFAALAEDYLQTGCRVLGFAGGVVGRVQDGEYVVAAVQSDYDALYPNFSCDLNDALCGQAIRSGQTITYAHIGSLSEMQHHPIYQAFGWESFISTPILVEGQVYGSLCFFSEIPRHQGFTNHEQEFIELMAQSIGKFLRNHQVEQQQQAAKAALRESEARFRQLAENIENVFWIVEPATQTFTYVSPAYEQIWQRPCADLLADASVWQRSLYPQDRDRLAVHPAMADSYDEEYRIVRPDGTVRWIRDRAFPLRNDQNQVYRVVGIAEDITDLKHQEQALRLIFEGTAAKTGHEFFRSLVRYLAQVLQVRYVVVGQRVPDNRLQTLAVWCDDHFVTDQTYDLAGTPCERVLAGQPLFYGEGVQQHYPQDPHLALWRAESYFGLPLTNANNEVIGHLAVLDDRPMAYDKKRELVLRIFAVRAGAELERQTFETEIQQAREAADAANRAKSEFLANISHELRTPLNTILGFTQLALHQCDRAHDSYEYLDVVNRSSEHLLALINDVLEMSKIEAGKISFNPHTFDLHSLLHSLDDMFSLRAAAKRIALQVRYSPAVPQFIETDESKLRQVLINLVGNAVKFTQQGGITLEVEVVSPSALGDRPDDTAARPAPESSHLTAMVLAFQVTDTGPGICPEEEQLLFEPFVQTTAGCRSQEGTGLGLPISQRFVQLMGGNLAVSTRPGEGSTFAFAIPVTPRTAAGNPPPTWAPHLQNLAPGQPEYRILVVDDHAANRQLMVRLLEQAGFAVRVAADGLAAVDQAQAWLPHLIWMDIRMPNLDGYGATQRIKALGLDPAPVIVALTASAFEDERSRVLQAGCEDFVRKPFQPDQIFQTMARHLPIRYMAIAADDAVARGAIAPPQAVGDRLRTLPHQWLQALEQAAVKGSDDRILQLVADLPPGYGDLGEQLTALAHNFQFDAILALLPATSSPTPGS